jgi:hypothetical protein
MGRALQSKARVNQAVRRVCLLLYVSNMNGFYFQDVSSCVLDPKLCGLKRVQIFYVKPQRIGT